MDERTQPWLFLLLETPGEVPNTVHFCEERVTLGKGPDSMVRLDAERMDRRHAMLSRIDTKSALLRDMGTTHGTYVDEQLCRQATIRTGDSFRLGETRIYLTAIVGEEDVEEVQIVGYMHFLAERGILYDSASSRHRRQSATTGTTPPSLPPSPPQLRGTDLPPSPPPPVQHRKPPEDPSQSAEAAQEAEPADGQALVSALLAELANPPTLTIPAWSQRWSIFGYAPLLLYSLGMGVVYGLAALVLHLVQAAVALWLFDKVAWHFAAQFVPRELHKQRERLEAKGPDDPDALIEALVTMDKGDLLTRMQQRADGKATQMLMLLSLIALTGALGGSLLGGLIPSIALFWLAVGFGSFYIMGTQMLPEGRAATTFIVAGAIVVGVAVTAVMAIHKSEQDAYQQQSDLKQIHAQQNALMPRTPASPAMLESFARDATRALKQQQPRLASTQLTLARTVLDGYRGTVPPTDTLTHGTLLEKQAEIAYLQACAHTMLAATPYAKTPQQAQKALDKALKHLKEAISLRQVTFAQVEADPRLRRLVQQPSYRAFKQQALPLLQKARAR